MYEVRKPSSCFHLLFKLYNFLGCDCNTAWEFSHSSWLMQYFIQWDRTCPLFSVNLVLRHDVESSDVLTCGRGLPTGLCQSDSFAAVVLDAIDPGLSALLEEDQSVRDVCRRDA